MTAVTQFQQSAPYSSRYFHRVQVAAGGISTHRLFNARQLWLFFVHIVSLKYHGHVFF